MCFKLNFFSLVFNNSKFRKFFQYFAKRCLWEETPKRRRSLYVENVTSLIHSRPSSCQCSRWHVHSKQTMKVRLKYYNIELDLQAQTDGSVNLNAECAEEQSRFDEFTVGRFECILEGAGELSKNISVAKDSVQGAAKNIAMDVEEYFDAKLLRVLPTGNFCCRLVSFNAVIRQQLVEKVNDQNHCSPFFRDFFRIPSEGMLKVLIKFEILQRHFIAFYYCLPWRRRTHFDRFLFLRKVGKLYFVHHPLEASCKNVSTSRMFIFWMGGKPLLASVLHVIYSKHDSCCAPGSVQSLACEWKHQGAEFKTAKIEGFEKGTLSLGRSVISKRLRTSVKSFYLNNAFLIKLLRFALIWPSLNQQLFETGETPARKEYVYTRSIPERPDEEVILRNFEEQMKLAELEEESDDLDVDSEEDNAETESLQVRLLFRSFQDKVLCYPKEVTINELRFSIFAINWLDYVYRWLWCCRVRSIFLLWSVIFRFFYHTCFVYCWSLFSFRVRIRVASLTWTKV